MDEQRMKAPSGDNHAGDMAYFERMYEQYATDVLRVSYFYLGDRQKAEEMGLWKQVQIRACQRIRERVPCPILRDASGRLPRSLTR